MQMRRCANILSRLFFCATWRATMPISEFFLVDAPIVGGDGDCPPPPPSAKRVSKLSRRVRSAWVRQRQMSAAPAGSSVEAAVRAEREKARADVLASCAAWRRQGKTPAPSLRESPPEHPRRLLSRISLVSRVALLLMSVQDLSPLPLLWIMPASLLPLLLLRLSCLGVLPVLVPVVAASARIC